MSLLVCHLALRQKWEIAPGLPEVKPLGTEERDLEELLVNEYTAGLNCLTFHCPDLDEAQARSRDNRGVIILYFQLPNGS